MLYFSSILELFTFVLHGSIPYTLLSLLSLLCYTVETPFIAHLHSCIYYFVSVCELEIKIDQTMSHFKSMNY